MDASLSLEETEVERNVQGLSTLVFSLLTRIDRNRIWRETRDIPTASLIFT